MIDSLQQKIDDEWSPRYVTLTGQGTGTTKPKNTVGDLVL
jgi:hypothetical protein